MLVWQVTEMTGPFVVFSVALGGLHETRPVEGGDGR